MKIETAVEAGKIFVMALLMLILRGLAMLIGYLIVLVLILAAMIALWISDAEVKQDWNN
jgi:hypothetical protein